MTVNVERRIIAGIADIKTVRLACKKCGTELEFPADLRIGIQIKCKNAQCEYAWPQDNLDLLFKHLEALRSLRTLETQEKSPFSVRFEFVEPN
jgi:hypothetical protein